MRGAFVVLLVLALAGCFGGSSDNSGTATSTSTTTTSSTKTSTGPVPLPSPQIDLLLNFELAPCTGIHFQTFQPVADVQALLPAGYEAQVTSRIPGGYGVLAVDFYSCQNLTTPYAQVPKTFYGQVYTLVKAPAGNPFATPEAQIHEYVFRVLAAEDILAILWQAAGYDVYNGTFTVVADPYVAVPPLNALYGGQASVGAGYFVQASGQPAGVNAPASKATFARYTVLEGNSTLVWTGRYDLGTPHEGEGFAQLPATDPFYRFRPPGGSFPGFTRIQESGGMFEMDLRRVFVRPT